MKMTLKLIMILSTIFLASSCRVLGKFEKKLVCKELRKNEIDPVVMCDISFKPETRCRCRCFDLNEYALANDAWCDTEEIRFETGDYPLERCQGFAGMNAKVWAKEIAPKIKRFSRIKSDMCD